jgi:ATP-dependent RNA helicase DeaD
MERQNLEGETVARRVSAAPKKKKPTAPKRGRNAVADKRKAPKTGSNRRQGPRK